MVLGLFRKDESADVIYEGGKIYTLNPDMPRVKAVACKNGQIIALGDEREIEYFKGKNTEVVDIEGGTILPGFIDVCGHPVLQAFEKACLILYDDMTQEETFDALANYIERNPDKHAYFAYGFDTTFLASKEQSELLGILDELCSDKPIVLLDISGAEGWFNTKALTLVKESLDENDPPVVTLPYILHVLSPIDFEQLQDAILEQIAEYCTKGYTTVFDCGAPDYLHSIYQEIIIELFQMDMLKLRFRGSHFVLKNLKPDYAVRRLLQKATSCSETDKYVDCNVLKLVLNDARTAEQADMKISLDTLQMLAKEATDRGFNMHIDALEKNDVFDAFEAVFNARNSGKKEAHFTIAHSLEFSEEERMELLVEYDVCETKSTLGDYKRKFRTIDNAENTSDAIDKLTIYASAQLGIDDEFGSIEVGKYADFVIYKDDPFGYDLPKFREAGAWMTVLGGNIAYSSEDDNLEKWQEMLKTKQQELNEQMLEDYTDDDEIFK
jgi:predicted amidohydrolase YtcJ